MSGSTDATLTASLTYNQVDMRYREQDGKGGLKPWIEGSFSLKANQPATFSGDANVIQGLFLSGGAVTLAAIPLAVPEPEAWGMLLAGLALVAGVSTRGSGVHRRPA